MNVISDIDATQAIRKVSDEEMILTEAELSARKDFLQFDQDDVSRLTDIGEIARQYAASVIEDFNKHLMSFDDTKAFFKDPEILAHVQKMQKAYFVRLTQGNYDLAYVENRLRIGSPDEKIGLPVKSFLGMYSFYHRAVAARLTDAFAKDPAKALATFLSLMKLTFLDIGLAIDTYVYSRERVILRQQEAIQELPTPVLPFRDGMLLVPVIGLLDPRRAQKLTEQLLISIRANRAKVVVMDITGVLAVDSKVANHLLQAVDAARLMGANVIVAGLSPEIAQTMVTLGVDLGRIETVGDLQSGIERSERLLGYQMVRTDIHATDPDKE